MTRDGIIMIPIAIALVAIPGVACAHAAMNPGSLQMNIHVPAQSLDTGLSEDRWTAGPLAEERKPKGQTGSRSTPPPPASEPHVDDRSMPRGSPEATYDLIGNMKKAGSKQGQKPK